MESVLLDIAIGLGGLAVGAFFRGMAFARKGDAIYVPRTECNLCNKAITNALEGVRGQLATLLKMHEDERTARHNLANAVQRANGLLWELRGAMNLDPDHHADER